MKPPPMPTTEVASPCVQVCELDAAQEVCVGCGRSLREIGEWSAASSSRRQEILDHAHSRQLAAGRATTSP